MTLRIRFAEPTDAGTIYRFICELALYEKEPGAVKVTPEILETQLASAHPPFECLVAETDEGPVGFALFFQTYSTWRGCPGIHLEDLYVPSAHRGQGYGAALLRRLAAITEARGFARLEWAVLDWNTPAIDFYRACGARALEQWVTYRLDGVALGELGASS